MRMKLLLLTVCCVIVTSLAGPFADKEEKLETAIHEIEAVLQDLGHNVDELSDLPTPKAKLSSPKSLPMEDVLLYTDNADKAIAEIKAAGGRVGIQMDKNLLIASLPNDVATKQDAFLHSLPEIPPTASENTFSNARAYKRYLEDKRRPKGAPAKWTEETAPKSVRLSEPLASGATTSVTGFFGVCSLVYSGSSDYFLSPEESEEVTSWVLHGLDVWLSNAPEEAEIGFKYRSDYTATGREHSHPTTCDPNDYSVCEKAFTVPGMMNHPCTFFAPKLIDNYEDYTKACMRSVADIDADIDESHILLVFASKYKLNHFAYAYPGTGPIVLEYTPGADYGLTFATLIGIVFNVPIEYTYCSDCENKKYGDKCPAENGNCLSCTVNQQECVMAGYYDSICPFTRKHVGWC